jgi:hypothetical protein
MQRRKQHPPTARGGRRLAQVGAGGVRGIGPPLRDGPALLQGGVVRERVLRHPDVSMAVAAERGCECRGCGMESCDFCFSPRRLVRPFSPAAS